MTRCGRRSRNSAPNLPDDVRLEIARSDRREYDRGRETRPRGANSHKGVNSKSGRKINARPRTGGHFVAIDSEGVNLSRTEVGRGRKKATYIDQRTCLWMAGGADGFINQTLINLDGCSSKQIFEFLLSLPRQFASSDQNGKAPIFVSFGFSYDVAKLLRISLTKRRGKYKTVGRSVLMARTIIRATCAVQSCGRITPSIARQARV